ncbi:MAG: heavy metal translocating P-type ATPase [Parvibaculum sp.]|nr:heavy metal translocating P-type ATPase [Parvibaculum sp.]
MDKHTHDHCNHGHGAAPDKAKDVVCGMSVTIEGAKHQMVHQGKTYYFCSAGCRQKFEADPQNYLTPKHDEPPVPAGTIFTCPMHPEVQQIGPGSCPKCGMALEPMMPSLDEAPNHELIDMQRRFIVSAVLGMPLVVFNMGGHAGFFSALMGQAQWIEAALATPVVLWCGAPFFVRGWASLVTRHFNMFTLIALGTGIAWSYSMVAMLAPQLFPAGFRNHMGEVPVYFEAAAVITLLVLLGQVLELKARERTGGAIRALLDLAPKTARRLGKDGSEQDIDLSDVHVGDELRVRPGDQVPVDGVILSGEGTIDQSMMTGEPLPVQRGVGEHVLAATLNQAGSFVMRADKVGAETTLSRIVQLVADAQRSRAPVQALVDQVASWFVPLVLASAALAFAVWATVGPEPRLSYGLVAAIAVLIIACPCALGLATPMSIMVGMGRGARAGVLVRNADALQMMERVDTLVIDKTGTLTEGRPSLVAVGVAPEHKENDVLRLAASLERGSEHPLAAAIVSAATERGLDIPAYTDFRNENGKGAAGLVEGKHLTIGSARFLTESGADVSAFATDAKHAAEQGATVIFLAIENQAAAYFVLADKVKSTAVPALAALREQGLHVIMATGDGKATADAVAKSLGIDEVLAEALPADKAVLIAKLRSEGRIVAMAGDGINDAPALAEAHIGIAMGTGSDIAMQSAGVTLLHGDLNGIVKARTLSHATMRNIRLNLLFAFAYNAAGVPVAAGLLYPAFGILLTPVMAAAAMALSSVSVIANALRLQRLKL